MSARTLKNKGFTLVEILIVVVILGILAAIVIPQFTQASESARASSLKSQLQTVRSQLELYQVQHNGTYPTLAELQTGDPDDWAQMTMLTETTGAQVATGAGNGDEVGPYMQKAPVNAFSQGNTGSNVIALANDGSVTGASATTGWAYNATNGAVKAIVPNQKAIDNGLVIAGFSAGDDDPDFWTY